MRKVLFSEREGYIPSQSTQVNDLDKDVRKNLYGLFCDLFAQIKCHQCTDPYWQEIGIGFFKIKEEELLINGQYNSAEITSKVKDVFLCHEWPEIFDLIEFTFYILLQDFNGNINSIVPCRVFAQLLNHCILSKNLTEYKFMLRSEDGSWVSPPEPETTPGVHAPGYACTDGKFISIHASKEQEK